MKQISVKTAELFIGKNLVNVRLEISEKVLRENPELKTGSVAVDLIPVIEKED